MISNTAGVVTKEPKLAVIMSTNLPLLKIKEYLGKQKVESYLVGGYLRDILMGRDSSDIDIAVATDALQIARNIVQTMNGTYVPLDKENQIARIILFQNNEQYTIDLSTLRNNIEEDLYQRDFTINAMATDLSELNTEGSITHIIDPFGGQKDLRNKLIRVVSETSLQSDPIRMLRAVRLAAELDFTIDSQTKSLISSQCQSLTKTAGERVHAELCHLMRLPQTYHWLRVMDNLGLMGVIIAELNEAKGIEQPIEHLWDVFDHSIETVKAVEYILYRDETIYENDVLIRFVPWSQELKLYFEQQVSGNLQRRDLMKIVALLHDIAKPHTKSPTENGRAHFFGHASKGAETSKQILTRLRFSNREIKRVQQIISLHMRVGQMNQPGEMPTRRAIYRYFRDAGDVAIDTLFFNLADHLAARGPQLDITKWQEHTHLIEYVLTESQQEEKAIKPPKLIDGHDVIRKFELKPGPCIGKLLEQVREMQATGEITTTEEALAVVQKALTTTAENN